MGAQLIISSRTVEGHLRNVFSNLGVSSRREFVRTAVNRVTSKEPVGPLTLSVSDWTGRHYRQRLPQGCALGPTNMRGTDQMSVQTTSEPQKRPLWTPSANPAAQVADADWLSVVDSRRPASWL